MYIFYYRMKWQERYSFKIAIDNSGRYLWYIQHSHKDWIPEMKGRNFASPSLGGSTSLHCDVIGKYMYVSPYFRDIIWFMYKTNRSGQRIDPWVTTGTIFITSLVWRGHWLGIEPGTSRTRSQHYTTRLSMRRSLTGDRTRYVPHSKPALYH